MTQDTFLITLPPQQLRSLQGWDVTPAHLAYRMGRGPRLLRAGGPVALRGGMMVVDDQDFSGMGPVLPFCQDVVQECQARGFAGVILDFGRRLPPQEQMAARLDEALARRGLAFFVPEPYAPVVSRGKVLISSALSGGSLTQRLEEAGATHGRDRIVLAVEVSCEDFSLPSPTGCGTPLSREQLRALMDRLRPSVFFSQELCARYFTYMDRSGGGHFVLFDDENTLIRKVEVARKAGVSAFLLPWAEVRNCAQRLGIRKVQTPAQRG